MGFSNVAKGFASTVVGMYSDSVLTGNQTAADNSTPLFVVGNGNADNERSNAMVVRKDGNVGIGTSTPQTTALAHISTGSSTTKGLLVTGVYNGSATIPDLGAGSRLMFYPGKAAFRAGYVNGPQWYNAIAGSASTAMGLNTIASGLASTAIGGQTTASGDYSTALGFETIALGDYSAAMGWKTTASGFVSTAMGEYIIASGEVSTTMGSYTTASGYSSTAMGSFTTASGFNSTAIGTSTLSKGYSSAVIGMYNDSILTADQGSVTSATPLFIIGNGDNLNSRSNAMVVRKDGGVGIGTNTPTGRVQVSHSSNTGSPTLTLFETNPTDFARLQFQNASGNKYWHVAGFINNTTDAASKLNFFHSVSGDVMSLSGNGNIGIGTSSPSQKLHVVGNICATGTIGACSDIRYKTNMLPLANVLSAVMSLQPIYYNWKKEYVDKGFADERHIGFSAQEIERLFPELVQTDANGYKAVDYSRLTPVLVQAMKEQQHKIDQQQNKIDQQQHDIELLKQQVQVLLKKS